MDREGLYIAHRQIKAALQSLLFYVFRIFPVKRRKIVITTIEGTTGFSCNPKYIVLELLKQNHSLPEDKRFEIVWLVNDMEKQFPEGIRKVHNTLKNRAYELTTAGLWIDNSRKQLEVRKRKGQIYLQTWHAKLGFKPTCLDRGASFPRIAYLVSKHDSELVDYWLSNSDWYDRTLERGSLYTGKTLRTGSPRCDILLNEVSAQRNRVRTRYGLSDKIKLMMLCPTFRGGSQGIDREISQGAHLPDIQMLLSQMKKRFGGEWAALLRLHPQLTARGIESLLSIPEWLTDRVIDISKEDDMYEILAGCDAFLTDYSSAAFDAAVMRIPIFLYCDDYEDYEGERGRLLWDLRKMPFPFASNEKELETQTSSFHEDSYRNALDQLFSDTGMVEDGKAAKRVVDHLLKMSSEPNYADQKTVS